MLRHTRSKIKNFHTCIQTSVETAVAIIQAAICLHNYARQTNSAVYCLAGFVDSEDRSGKIKEGEWRRIVSAQDALRPLPLARGWRQVKTAVEVREVLKNYLVSSEGAVAWYCYHYVRSRGPIIESSLF